MPNVPPTGPSPPKPPEGTPSKSPTPIEPADQKDAFLLQSPFAKMFAKTGAMPTIKEMRAIMNGILQQEIDAIKRQDASWKKAMKKLKRQLEGDE